MSGVHWGSVLLAAAVALAAPAALRPLLARSGVIDVPNARSSHERPTLRGGGLASLVGVAAGGLVAALALPAPSGAAVAIITAGGVAVALVGLAEDVVGLRVGVRAAAQFAVGAVVAGALAGLFGAAWGWVPLAALAFAAHVNFTNFMDGLNGISSLHGLAAGGAYALLGAWLELPWLATIGLILAAAFLAFLPWNLIPPGMFLGDVGSYLLGGGLAATALACLAAGVHPPAAIAPLLIYWLDTVVTLVRRALRREPLLTAHRSHTYQRLTTLGLSHLTVNGTVAALTAAAGLVGLLAATGSLALPATALALLALCALYLALPRLLGRTPR